MEVFFSKTFEIGDEFEFEDPTKKMLGSNIVFKYEKSTRSGYGCLKAITVTREGGETLILGCEQLGFASASCNSIGLK
jgi:hypothetical protein